jgi:DNA repair protein RadD
MLSAAEDDAEHLGMLAEALNERLSPSAMRTVLDRGVERIVATTESPGDLYRVKVNDTEVASLLLTVEGVDVLRHLALRRMLVEQANEEQLEELHSYDPAAPPQYTRAPKVRVISDRNWHPGKSWAQTFVRVLQLPEALAGVPGLPDPPSFEDVEPYIPLPALHDYQQNLVDELLDLLSVPDAKRGILTLPTGAGKTRTAVEALLEWWIQYQNRHGVILWLAAHDELCEQACLAFRQVWSDWGIRRGERQALRLQRWWGSRTLGESLASGVIVSSVSKIDRMVDNPLTEGVDAGDLMSLVALVVVDEAHHATAPSYRKVLNWLGVSPRTDGTTRIPLLGLTATPYRGWDHTENQKLARLFGNRLIQMRVVGSVLDALRERGVLARVVHQVLETGLTYDLTDDELRQVTTFGVFPDTFLRKLGEDRARNRLILKRLLGLNPECPTLFFGCSIQHAIAMAALLNRNGRSAVVVTGHTRPALRRQWIEEFRNGGIQVLCNYNVLTTGFDAPQVGAVVVARPTTSPVLYEQMIGRGMRGPKNGGTGSCLVIDAVDNIVRFRGELAYSRFEEYWVAVNGPDEAGSLSGAT